jgi:hypothetical protein
MFCVLTRSGRVTRDLREIWDRKAILESQVTRELPAIKAALDRRARQVPRETQDPQGRKALQEQREQLVQKGPRGQLVTREKLEPKEMPEPLAPLEQSVPPVRRERREQLGRREKLDPPDLRVRLPSLKLRALLASQARFVL